MREMGRIAVVAHKGGTGKTTVALNLGAELAVGGYRVLLVDADPQGALGAALGQLTVEKPTLYEVLTGVAPIDAAIKPAGLERLDLIGADLDLSGLEVELPRQPGWQGALRAVLEPLRAYDFVVIDTAPGLGILPYVALAASTAVLVVTPPEFLAYRALRLVQETVERARQEAPGLRLLGIVPTFVTRQTRHAREVLGVLRDDYGEQLLPEIPRRVVLQDAALAGQAVCAYAPGSGAAGAFAKLAKEVIARVHSTP